MITKSTHDMSIIIEKSPFDRNMFGSLFPASQNFKQQSYSSSLKIDIKNYGSIFFTVYIINYNIVYGLFTWIELDTTP